MKKITQFLLCICLMFGLCTFSALPVSAKIKTSESIIHEVLLTDEDDGGDYKEYLVIYYSDADNRLTCIQDESVFYKNKGYDKSFLQDNGEAILDEVYPNFKTYPFGTWSVEDEADTVSFVILFNDLTKKENLKMMYDDELIIPENKNDDGSRGVDAPYFIQSIVDGGGKKLSSSEIEKAGLHIQDFNGKTETTEKKETTSKIVNEVLLTDDDAEGDYKEYLIIYYSDKDKIMHAIQDETVFYKDHGYDKDFLQENGETILEQVYPGFKDYSFVSWEIVDEADTVSFIILFDQLNKKENLVKMYEGGLIIPEDKNDDGSRGVDAPYFIKSIKSGGGKTIAASDVAAAHLHIYDNIE